MSTEASLSRNISITEQLTLMLDVIHYANAFMAVLDENLNTLICNRQILNYCNKDSPTLIGEPFFPLIYNDNELGESAAVHFQMMRQVFVNWESEQEQNVVYFTFEAMDSFEDRQIPLRWDVSEIKTKHGIFIVLTGRDESLRAQMESENMALATNLQGKNLELQDQYDALQIAQAQNMALQNIVRQYTPQSTWIRALQSSQRGELTIPQEELDITMMFGDVQGFTRFAERQKPVEVIASLNELFEIITREVYAHGGDIDKFIGDAFFAIFDDPLKATQAGLAIISGVDQLNDQRMEDGRTPLYIRIGMNSGEVIRGNVGGEVRKDNTLIGDAVNLAQRLESSALPGSLLVSELTYNLIKPYVHTGEPQELSVKGRKKTIIAFPVERLLTPEEIEQNAASSPPLPDSKEEDQ